MYFHAILYRQGYYYSQTIISCKFILKKNLATVFCFTDLLLSVGNSSVRMLNAHVLPLSLPMTSRDVINIRHVIIVGGSSFVFSARIPCEVSSPSSVL